MSRKQQQKKAARAQTRRPHTTQACKWTATASKNLSSRAIRAQLESLANPTRPPTSSFPLHNTVAPTQTCAASKVQTAQRQTYSLCLNKQPQQPRHPNAHAKELRACQAGHMRLPKRARKGSRWARVDCRCSVSPHRFSLLSVVTAVALVKNLPGVQPTHPQQPFLFLVP
jgi:hypothetical protein